jgi:hypothetical protein
MFSQLITDEVYSFKLNSGEELIAKLKEIGTGHVTVEEPVSIAPGPQGMGLVPSMFTADNKETIRLNTSSVSLVASTEDNVKMKYLEATTGIKVPSKKLVLG